MSRPVSEPTTQRSVRGVGFSADQLFRRPAPPAGAVTYEWARRKVDAQSNQSISSGSETNVLMSDFQTSDASIFQAFDNGTQNGIQTLFNEGLYLMTCRLYWNQWPNDHEMTINGVDPDAFAGYTFRSGAPNNTYSFTGGMHCRLGLNAQLWMTTYHTFGSARTLFGGAGAGGGSFIELVYLGPINLDDRDWA